MSRARFPELDCLRGFLPERTLEAAARRALAIGTGADRVLITAGLVDESTYLARFAIRFGVHQSDLAQACLADAAEEDLRLAAQSGMLRMRIGGIRVLVTTLRGLRARRLAILARENPREAGRIRLITEEALQNFLLYRTERIIAPAIGDLQARYPALSAAPAKSRARRLLRKTMFWIGLAGVVAAGVASPAASGHALALVFLAAMALRIIASLRSVEPGAAPRLSDADLPDYSVVAALYREENSVAQLLASLLALDYPREKLDIILVVETDDLATRAAIARLHPPSFVRVVVAPDKGPRTKPKALNVALPFVRGTYLAVFDAEDRPDPGQLRAAVAAFAEGDDDLACVQARLAIHSSHTSVFTRMFAAEYAGQFDILMPGYDRLRLPWPLGGTSNHFRADRLRAVSAWDPFNVTEDADLGLRFARFGYRTASIAATTWEEAPARFIPWLKQRTRWMKGWMQTWAVHSRQRRRYFRKTGWRGILARDLMIGGALLAALAYPVSLALVIWLMLDPAPERRHAIADLISPLHGACFAVGLTVSILIQARGLARRGRLRDAWILIATPVYWACLSMAAWRALIQLRNDPYLWEKTEHGQGPACSGPSSQNLATDTSSAPPLLPPAAASG